LFALLQPLGIEHEALDDELSECSRGPDSELSRLEAVHPVPDGDDHVEVVEINVSPNLPATLLLNYSKFSNSSFLTQLLGTKDLFAVVVDRRDLHAEQLCHAPLAEPESLCLIVNFYSHVAIGCNVEENFALRGN
jgi:hypothetical protein